MRQCKICKNEIPYPLLYQRICSDTCRRVGKKNAQRRYNASISEKQKIKYQEKHHDEIQQRLLQRQEKLLAKKKFCVICGTERYRRVTCDSTYCIKENRKNTIRKRFLENPNVTRERNRRKSARRKIILAAAKELGIRVNSKGEVEMNMLNLSIKDIDEKTTPREVLKRVIEANANAGKNVVFRKFLAKLQGRSGERLLESVIEYWFSLNYHSIVSTPSDEKSDQRAKIEKIKGAIRSRILDMVLPNGKTLAENKFSYVKKLGGGLTRIGDAGKANQIVGQVLSERKIKKLFTGEA